MSFGFICWNKRALTRSHVILLISTGAIYQFAVMRSFIVTFHKSQTVLRTGVIGNILLKRYTLKPGLAFPQNLASSETLVWHFWLGLRFGLFKNVGLKFKKRVLFTCLRFFSSNFYCFHRILKTQCVFNTDQHRWSRNIPPQQRFDISLLCCYLVSLPK